MFSLYARLHQLPPAQVAKPVSATPLHDRLARQQSKPLSPPTPTPAPTPGSLRARIAEARRIRC